MPRLLTVNPSPESGDCDNNGGPDGTTDGNFDPKPPFVQYRSARGVGCGCQSSGGPASGLLASS